MASYHQHFLGDSDAPDQNHRRIDHFNDMNVAWVTAQGRIKLHCTEEIISAYEVRPTLCERSDFIALTYSVGDGLYSLARDGDLYNKNGELVRRNVPFLERPARNYTLTTPGYYDGNLEPFDWMPAINTLCFIRDRQAWIRWTENDELQDDQRHFRSIKSGCAIRIYETKICDGPYTSCYTGGCGNGHAFAGPGLLSFVEPQFYKNRGCVEQWVMHRNTREVDVIDLQFYFQWDTCHSSRRCKYARLDADGELYLSSHDITLHSVVSFTVSTKYLYYMDNRGDVSRHFIDTCDLGPAEPVL